MSNTENKSRNGMKQVVRGRIFEIENIDRKFGADPSYFFMWGQAPDRNKDYAYLFTAEELEAAKQRGKANLEDIKEKGMLLAQDGYDEPLPTEFKENSPVGENTAGSDVTAKNEE